MDICIVGTSRSGSTLLADLLISTEKLVIFNETQWLPILYASHQGERLSFDSWLSLARQVTWDDGQNLVDQNIERFAKDKQAVYDRLEHACQHKTPTSLQDFHRQLKDIIFHGYPHELWGDKTPDYGPYMQVIQALWPDCKFIHSKRNPLDCALSMRHHRGCRIQIHQEKISWLQLQNQRPFDHLEDGPVTLQAALENWLMRMEAIEDQRKKLPRGSYLDVAYEELALDAEPVVSKVLSFLTESKASLNGKSFLAIDISRASINKAFPDDSAYQLSSSVLKRLLDHLPLFEEESTLKGRALFIQKQIPSICRHVACLTELLQAHALPKFMSALDVFYELFCELAPRHTFFFAVLLIGKSKHQFVLDEMMAIMEGRGNQALMLLIKAIHTGRTNLQSLYLHHCLSNNRIALLQCAADYFLLTNGMKKPLLVPLIHSFIKQKHWQRAQSLIIDGGFNQEQASDIELFIHLAKAKHDHGAALSLAKTLVELQGNEPKNWLIYANTLHDNGYFKQVMLSLEKALNQWPANDLLFNRLLQTYTLLGQRLKRQSLFELQSYRLLDTEYLESYINTLIEKGDFYKAKRHIQLVNNRRLFAELMADLYLSQRRFTTLEQWVASDYVNRGGRKEKLFYYYLALSQLQKAQGILSEIAFKLPQEQSALMKLHFQQVNDGPAAALHSAFTDLSHINSPAIELKKIDWLMQELRFEDAMARCQDVQAGRRHQIDSRLAAILIGQGKFDQAAQMIDQLEGLALSKTGVWLSIWRLNYGAQYQQAKQVWTDFKRNHFVPEVQSALKDLTCIHGHWQSHQQSNIVLIAALRNERPLLPAFFDHYRKMGIKSFILVDNDSDDGSTEWLMQQKDVVLFHTKVSYKQSCYGIQWINTLKNHYFAQQWCLYVDIDEFLVIEPSYQQSLSSLLYEMDALGEEAMAGFMVDMFSENLGQASRYKAGSNPLSLASYFDDDYTVVPSPRPPFVSIFGGFRRRFFWRESMGNPLVKTPLVKGERMDFLSSSHTVSPGKIRKANCVLMHFKFLGDCEERFKEEVERKEHALIYGEYERYRKRLLDFSKGCSLVGDASLMLKKIENFNSVGYFNFFKNIVNFE